MAFSFDEFSSFNSSPFSLFPGGSSTSAANAGDEEDADKLSARELSELRLDQLLHADFALKQTRGASVRSQLKFNTEYDKEDEEDDSAPPGSVESERKGPIDYAVAQGNLVSTVLKEARIEHLSAGFGQDAKLAAHSQSATTNTTAKKSTDSAAPTAKADASAPGGKSSDATIGRLARELAAQAFTAGSYQNLLNRRSLLLASLQRAFVAEYRAAKVSLTRKKKLGSGAEADLLTKTAVQSGLHVLLRFLTESPTAVKIEILDYLKARITSVPAMAFKIPDTTDSSSSATANPSAAGGAWGAAGLFGQSSGGASGSAGSAGPAISPEISSEAFATLHRFMYQLAMEPSTAPEVRERCIELILGMAVACSSLPFFLSVVKLLMFPSGSTPITHVSVLPLLHKLHGMRDEVFMQQPSDTNHETKMAVTELSTALSIAVASDGRFLYTHSRAGLFKIGTGKSGSTHGMVYAAVRGFRGNERSTLACYGNYLYYRSPQIAPAVFLVLSTEHLLEVGSVLVNGKGTFATVDLTAVGPGLAMEDPKSKKSVASKSSAAAAAAANASAEDDKSQPLEKDEKDGKSAAPGKSAEPDGKSAGPAMSEDEKAILKKKQAQAGQTDGKDKDPIALKKAQHEAEMSGKSGAPGKSDDDKHKSSADDKQKDPSAGTGTGADRKSVAPTDQTAMNLGDLKTDNKSADPNPTDAPGPAAANTDLMSGMGEAPLSAAEEATKKLAAEKAKRPLTRFTPVLSDGRFVYVVVPEPVEAKAAAAKDSKDSTASGSSGSSGSTKTKSDKITLNVHAFDPRKKLSHAHSVKLRQAPPRASSVLGCGTQATGGPTTDQYGGYKSTKQCPLANVNLGCPAHLNFDGSFTVEAWVRIPRESWNKMSYHGVFWKGDPSYRFYTFIQRGSVHCGINTRAGQSASAMGNCTIPDDEWFHLAVTADMSAQSWFIYVNGNQIGTGRGTTGMNANGCDWVLASSKVYPAFLYMAEVRIWKRALNESQLKAGLKAPVSSDADGLLGYWPLADGFGMCIRNLSSFSLSCILRGLWFVCM